MELFVAASVFGIGCQLHVRPLLSKEICKRFSTYNQRYSTNLLTVECAVVVTEVAHYRLQQWRIPHGAIALW